MNAKYYGPFCAGERAYAVIRMKMTAKERSDLGIVYPLDGSGPPIMQELHLPHVKNHNSFNVFFVFQGKPCVIFDRWDKETAVVTLFLQRYSSATFEPEGAAQEIGVLRFNERSYLGTDVELKVEHAPDGQKLLIYYDALSIERQQGVVCWVLDKDFAPVWQNAFKMPVLAHNTRSKVRFTNTGDVYVAIYGAAITDDLIKQEEGDSGKVMVLAASLTRPRFTGAHMRGDLFEVWNGNLQPGVAIIDGTIERTHTGTYIAGVASEGDGKDALKWVLVRMDDTFSNPEVIAQGPLGEGKSMGSVASLAAPDGSLHFYLSGGGRKVIAEFDANARMKWSTASDVGISPDLFVHKGVIHGGMDLSAEDVDNLRAGRSMKETFDRRPHLISWDNEGVATYSALIPYTRRIKKGSYYDLLRSSYSNIPACGSYVFWDNEHRPSLYRVKLD